MCIRDRNTVLEAIETDTPYKGAEKTRMKLGVDVLPGFNRDTTDRNRTSPFAFTGNKFEFRMLGSSQSIAGPNIALNTIMAEELGQFADELEHAKNFDNALQQLICRTLTDHQRIIFNGNGYSHQWQADAHKRGLSNHPSTAESLEAYISPKNIALVTKRAIFTEAEFHARYEIHLEAYIKIVNIEARTSVDMVQHQILPAALAYSTSLCNTVIAKEKVGASCRAEKALLGKLSAATDALYEKCERLKEDLLHIPAGSEASANYYHNVIIADMDALRSDADLLEELTDKSYWPYPTYSDLLFY